MTNEKGALFFPLEIDKQVKVAISAVEERAIKAVKKKAKVRATLKTAKKAKYQEKKTNKTVLSCDSILLYTIFHINYFISSEIPIVFK